MWSEGAGPDRGSVWPTGLATPAPDTSRNWLGIAALVLGIVGGSVLALVFAMLGLRAVENGKATNRGLSLAGLVLGSAWGTVVIYAAVSAVLSLGESGGTAVVASGPGATTGDASVSLDASVVPLSQVAVGDCYRSDSGGARPGSGLVSVSGLVIVDCARDHNAEIFFVATLDGAITPGDPDYAAAGFRECGGVAATEHLEADARASASLMIETYSPQQDGWDRGERYLVCGAVDHDADLHASLTRP